MPIATDGITNSGGKNHGMWGPNKQCLGPTQWLNSINLDRQPCGRATNQVGESGHRVEEAGPSIKRPQACELDLIRLIWGEFINESLNWQKSENALADAKLRVSQTRNEQLIHEREMNTKEAELAAEQQKYRTEKEWYEIRNK